VPSGGSVSADVGTSLVRLGGSGALLIGSCAVLVLLVRWLVRELQSQRWARRRRRRSLPRHPVHRPSPALARRRARHPSAHHPAGPQPPSPTGPSSAIRPRRPIEVVAAELRRLTRELAVVPGGVPLARRRGLLAAYDDLLVEAADLLEVPQQLTTQPPAGRELERIRLLAVLEARGLVVGG
jgi:hypothetical protein